ncbi:MAG: hypothetical protein ACRCYY_08980 [Trueperaceae bacterium]
MSTELQQAREIEIKRLIARLCEEYEVEVSFMTNRRHTDVVTCVLSGPRDLVLPIPVALLEGLEFEDIEVIRSRQEGLDYLLQLVITTELERQFSQNPERRAKLRNR